jgi:hypothetical protein
MLVAGFVKDWVVYQEVALYKEGPFLHLRPWFYTSDEGIYKKQCHLDPPVSAGATVSPILSDVSVLFPRTDFHIPKKWAKPFPSDIDLR